MLTLVSARCPVLVIGFAFLALSVAGAAFAAAPSPDSQGILARTLEAARQEKRVVRLVDEGELGVAGVKEVEAAFNRKYPGLNAHIEYSLSPPSYAATAAKMLQEQRARVRPSFDVFFATEGVFLSIESERQKRGKEVMLSIERELLTKETPPEALVHNGLGVVNFHSFYPLFYNPKLVPSEQAPAGYRDLTDPKWRGKFQLVPSPTASGQYGIHFGKNEWLEIARKLGENKPILEFYGPAFARFTTGELPIIGRALDNQLFQARKAGLPVALGSLEATMLAAHTVHVNRDAPSPNTAKLFAAFLASPEVAAIQERIGTRLNYFYPKSRGVEIADALKAQERQGKTKIYRLLDHMDYLRWLELTKEGKEYGQKVVQLLRGG